ncbi:Pre-rRNA-processing protein crb3/ipi3 [Cyphellophora attinorum]|uniref:Pre-rRNA-processing protein IPI3 n=1 Tax=Cyphellophora attinorum TaxID=1664694 RepID=A0A0N1HNY2_9EURO|nr:Pre-rRNA-processing protein crb3/ipi3 [Phialophora attinorum]KPI36860.1 Pre-rRNA-processing protein crb3/ipi3 [Phialophora attinorum]
MLTGSLIAATLTVNAPSQHLAASLKDVGVFQYDIQPQTTLRTGFKKSSTNPRCLAVSRAHIYAAQATKAVVHVYSRQKGNLEATVPFPDRIHSVAFAEAAQVLILGTDDGKLVLWEVGTGRITTSSASHLQAVTQLRVTPDNDLILSGSPDTTVQIWSLSQLLSFSSSAHSYSGEASNVPINTFENHRNPITALSCGNSRSSTNFAVSAAADSTCHIWQIQSCQILRTVLLPAAPMCIAIDPADRAAYLGDESGSISHIDLIELGQSTVTSGESGRLTDIGKQKQWTTSSNAGSMHCLDVSYDGTYLVSGHTHGDLLRWDVAKHKVMSDVSKLGQPISNVQILRPEGLPEATPVSFDIVEVTKPRLEFAAQSDSGSTNIPATYKLHASLRGKRQSETNAVALAMTTDGWPSSILDAAVDAVSRSGADSQSQVPKSTLRQAETLKTENEQLKRNLAAHKEAELQRMERSLQRMARREDIDLDRRKAYHQAIKNGADRKTANGAMLEVEAASQRERDQLDADSDAEAFPDAMDVG